MDPADFYFFNHKKGRSINQLVQLANVLIIVFNMILLKTSAGYYVYIYIYIL